MAILHMAGFAKEYRMIGKTTAKFTVGKNELESDIVNDINKLDFK